jgi:hypothetical protein
MHELLRKMSKSADKSQKQYFYASSLNIKNMAILYTFYSLYEILYIILMGLPILYTALTIFPDSHSDLDQQSSKRLNPDLHKMIRKKPNGNVQDPNSVGLGLCRIRFWIRI